MTTYIENYGYTNTHIDNNNKKSESSVSWIGNYDGNIANVDMTINNNGNEKSLNLQLDNEDLLNLLNIPSNQIPLEKRLINDFFSPNTPTPIPVIQIPNTLGLEYKKIKNKRKTKKLKSKRAKSKKNNILKLFQ
jgi:hypothetical protein